LHLPKSLVRRLYVYLLTIFKLVVICLSIDVIKSNKRQRNSTMADEPTNKFTHIGVEKSTQRKVSLLAKVHGCDMYDLVAIWADASWNQAKVAGLVTDAMLEPQKAHVVGKDKIVEFDAEDGKKLLQVVRVKGAKKVKA